MPNERAIHVAFDGRVRLWTVMREGALSNLASYATREKATEKAARIARRERGEVVVHDPDGGPDERISFAEPASPPPPLGDER